MNNTNQSPLQLQTVEDVIEFLTVFKDIDDTVPLQIIITFLTVALHPYSTMSEIAEITERSPTTTSRHLRDLGELNRFKKPGYKLVVHEDNKMDLRVKNYVLTPKGRRLLERVIAKYQNRKA